MFTPVKLGNTTLPPEVLKADKKSCKRYGPCGVGEQALYLNSFFIDRRYYVALESVRRVFKRVAMSKGGFTGKGAFGSIPYLVVELDDGSQKQCNFKHEEDVDLLLAHMARVCPDIPRHSVEAERRLREKAEREAKRYLKQLTPQAQAARETLEQAQQLLEEYPEQTAKLSTAAKAKRVNDRSNPAYRWVRRVFKRVAMSKGGFTGKGAFGSIPYLVVELDDGSQKQCNFKHEEDVDLLLAHMARVCPDIPRHSVEAERRLREKAEREAKRYLKQLTPQAQAARETLEQAQQLLEEYPEQTAKLSTAAKAKRVNDRSNPAYRWVALAIIVAGIAAVVYGIMALIRGENVGVYFALFGLAAIFFFSGAHVLPTAKNNKKAIAQEWERSISDVAALLPEDFPVPARYAHPVVLQRMIRVLREGRAQSVGEALKS